jgi:hypothetical protein
MEQALLLVRLLGEGMMTDVDFFARSGGEAEVVELNPWT